MEDKKSLLEFSSSGNKTVVHGSCISSHTDQELGASPSSLATLLTSSPKNSNKHLPELVRIKYSQMKDTLHKAEMVEITAKRFESWLKKKLHDKACEELPYTSPPPSPTGMEGCPSSFRKRCLSVPPPSFPEKQPIDIPLYILAFFLRANLGPVSATLVEYMDFGRASSRMSFPKAESSARTDELVFSFGSLRVAANTEAEDASHDVAADLDYSDDEVFAEETRSK